MYSGNPPPTHPYGHPQQPRKMWNPNEGLHYNWQHNSLHVANPLYRLRERTADPTPYEISESERTATDAAWAELCSESGAPSWRSIDQGTAD